MKPKRVRRIHERKLRRHQAVGLCWSTGKIEVDPRLKAKERLDTVIHEMLHFELPALAEKTVLKVATHIAEVLWRDRYRRVER